MDLERIRESLAKELVNLANKIENLETQAKLYPDLEDRFTVSVYLKKILQSHLKIFFIETKFRIRGIITNVWRERRGV